MIKTINMHDTVLCDMCNKDYTRSEEKGGFDFAGKAICPSCAPSIMEGIQKYDEQEFINSICPKDMSFADYVRKVLRGGKPGVIEIINGKDLNDYMNSLERNSNGS